jgi:mono/diheme cytochrome c family protein
VQKQSDTELAAIIESGKGKMPAYGKSLKPEQVKELVAYIRSLAKK